MSGNRKPNLDQIEHRDPCPQAWESLIGDERARHCGVCEKYVHNLAALTRTEAQELVRQPHVCARFEKDAWGSIVTADGPPTWELGRRRLIRTLATVFGLAALLPHRVRAGTAPVLGRTEPLAGTPQTASIEIKRSSGSDIEISGVVIDMSGAVIPRTSVELFADANLKKPRMETTTGAAGEFALCGIRAGSYSLSAYSEGFQTFQGAHLTLSPGDRVLVQIPLEVGYVGEWVELEGIRQSWLGRRVWRLGRWITYPFRALTS